MKFVTIEEQVELMAKRTAANKARGLGRREAVAAGCVGCKKASDVLRNAKRMAEDETKKPTSAKS